MVGAIEIGAALSGLKAALDVTKGLKATADAVAINDAKIALQSAIIDAQTGLMSAQEAQAANLQAIDDLKKKLAGFENWETEKQRYHLKSIDSGAVAYVHKPGMEADEAPVWLCQPCFEERHKSSLQLKDPNAGHGGARTHHRYACNRCKGDVVVRYTRNPTKPYDPSPPPSD